MGRRSDPRVALHVGQIMRQARRDKRWTQARLAAQSGLHRADTIGAYESGAMTPSLEVLVDIARALELPPARFVEGL